MPKKTVLILLTAMLVVLLMTTVAAAAPENSTAYWWWGEEAGSATIVRTPNGIHGTFKSSLANELGSAHGLTVTLWLVVFNNPGACATSPCGEPDLFNAAVQPDVLYGSGTVIGASEKAALGFSLNAGDNSGSIAGLFGLPDNNGQSWGLIDPQTAEVHYVLRAHGPKVPAYMPAQIQTYGGGCIDNAPIGYPVPAGPGDLYLDLGQCQDIQFAINLP